VSETETTGWGVRRAGERGVGTPIADDDGTVVSAMLSGLPAVTVKRRSVAESLR